MTLTPGAFGTLSEPDELAKDYEEQRTQSLGDLKDAANALEGIVDAVKEKAKAYDQTVDDVGSRPAVKPSWPWLGCGTGRPMPSSRPVSVSGRVRLPLHPRNPRPPDRTSPVRRREGRGR